MASSPLLLAGTAAGLGFGSILSWGPLEIDSHASVSSLSSRVNTTYSKLELSPSSSSSFSGTSFTSSIYLRTLSDRDLASDSSDSSSSPSLSRGLEVVAFAVAASAPSAL